MDRYIQHCRRIQYAILCQLKTRAGATPEPFEESLTLNACYESDYYDQSIPARMGILTSNTPFGNFSCPHRALPIFLSILLRKMFMRYTVTTFKARLC